MRYSNDILRDNLTSFNTTIYEKQNIYSAAPPQHIFAMIPIKVSGVPIGSTLVEFGGSLQNQIRRYYAPVHLSKLSIQLLSDKNSILDINGSNWSFSIVVEMYY
jgi:hypothetical protein